MRNVSPNSSPRRLRSWWRPALVAGGAYLLAGGACPCCGRPACAVGLGGTVAVGTFASLCSAVLSRWNARITRRAWVVLLPLALLAAGCERQEPAAPERPLIVTTFFPLHDFARAVAGEDFTVRCLVPPGGDPHAVEASPALARELAAARVVITLGLGMDDWATKLAAGTGVRPVRLGEHLLTRRAGRSELARHAETVPDPEATDPHVWLDPQLAREMIRQLSDVLAALRPERATAIRARAAAYDAELQTLHDEFARGLAACPRREVVTFHGAFAYLFARYELRTLGVVEMFPGHEPSAAYLRDLVDLMRRTDVKVIFAEPQLPDRAARVIAAEIGGRVERLDPCETILPDEPAATYLERQRRNLATLRHVLGEESLSR